MKKANFCYAVLTASAVLTLGTVFSASAAQWQALGDEWVYVQNDGEYFKDGWKQDGNLYYYLGSDGIMLRRTLIEDDDNYYYLGSSGAMATNVWKFIQNPEWQGDELVGEGSWYYFGSNGKAIKSDGSKAKVYERSMDGSRTTTASGCITVILKSPTCAPAGSRLFLQRQ